MSEETKPTAKEPKPSTPPPDKPPKSVADKAKEVWSVISIIGTLLSFILGGVLWVNSKFREYEQRGVDIQDLQEMNQKILDDTADLKEMISQVSQNTTERIAQELDKRDKTDRHLQSSIVSVLNEMRARHGIVPLAIVEDTETEDGGRGPASTGMYSVSVRAASERSEQNVRASSAAVMRETRALAEIRTDL